MRLDEAARGVFVPRNGKSQARGGSCAPSRGIWLMKNAPREYASGPARSIWCRGSPKQPSERFPSPPKCFPSQPFLHFGFAGRRPLLCRPLRLRRSRDAAFIAHHPKNPLRRSLSVASPPDHLGAASATSRGRVFFPRPLLGLPYPSQPSAATRVRVLADNNFFSILELPRGETRHFFGQSAI